MAISIPRPDGEPPDGLTPSTVKPFLNVGEAAALLGTSRSTLYRAIKAGNSPVAVLTVGRRMRIARKAIESLLPAPAPGESRLRPSSKIPSAPPSRPRRSNDTPRSGYPHRAATASTAISRNGAPRRGNA